MGEIREYQLILSNETPYSDATGFLNFSKINICLCNSLGNMEVIDIDI